MKFLKYLFVPFVLFICTSGFWPRNETKAQNIAVIVPAKIAETEAKGVKAIIALDSSKGQNEKGLQDHKQQDDARDLALTKANNRITELEADLKTTQRRLANAQNLLAELKSIYIAAQGTDTLPQMDLPSKKLQ